MKQKPAVVCRLNAGTLLPNRDAPTLALEGFIGSPSRYLELLFCIYTTRPVGGWTCRTLCATLDSLALTLRCSAFAHGQ